MAELSNRQRWSQPVVDELGDFFHALTSDGRIAYASSSCKAVTVFDSTELEGRFLSAFIHPDDYEVYIKTLNDSWAFAVQCDSSTASAKLIGNGMCWNLLAMCMSATTRVHYGLQTAIPFTEGYS